MDELIFKTIKVDALNDTEKKVTLVSGKEKYNFWKKKQDGSLTKAYQQFQELRVGSGSEYPVAVKEEEKTFRNEAGKDITFMDRSIMYFALKEAGQGQVQHSQETPETPVHDMLHAFEFRIEKMADWAKKMEGEVKSLRALVELVAGENATTLHAEVPPKAKIETVPWTERDATEQQGDNQSYSR